MASYLDQVPFSGIIRIRDMMYSVPNPYRLDQGDVSFDAPDTVKAAMARAIAENRSHYLQTNGVPRLRELIAAKLRQRNGIPIAGPDDVLVTNGGIHGLYITCMALLEPGDEVLIPDPEWPPTAGNILAARGVPVGYKLDQSIGWRPDFADLIRRSNGAPSDLSAAAANVETSLLGANGAILVSAHSRASARRVCSAWNWAT